MSLIRSLAPVLVFVVLGCQGSDGGPSAPDPGALGDAGTIDGARDLLAELAASRTLWTAIKQRNGSSYDYVSRWTIYPSPRDFDTRIEVRADRVVKRSYGLAGQPPEWVETGDQVGMHSSGDSSLNLVAPALTIDEIYERCAADVLPLRSERTSVTLSFRPDGVIEHCVHRPVNCADTCEQGLRVSELISPGM